MKNFREEIFQKKAKDGHSLVLSRSLSLSLSRKTETRRRRRNKKMVKK
jgi:hypothetical protein|tara:strand:- start:162 stop:305 length:144 start_codon:yes stop_codon:yes gene_type:complete